MRLMVNGHNVHLIKSTRASGTFAHAVRDAIVNTLATEQVTALLQGRVLEVIAADRT